LSSLKRLQSRIERSKKPLDRAPIHQQIGRLLQRNSRAAARFEISLEDSDAAAGFALKMRKAKSVEAALPWLYLRGISTGDMQEALAVMVGDEAKGLSAPVVSRLKLKWQAEYRRWGERRLDADRWVYLWADGIYSGLRGEDGRLCVLVVMGVNERGQKRFLAIEDGVRESTQSWREVLPLSTGNVMDMYKSIAWELGLPTERNRATCFRALQTEISRLVLEAKQRPVVIVDEAHHLRNDVLERSRTTAPGAASLARAFWARRRQPPRLRKDAPS
jgi:hypothetical protein